MVIVLEANSTFSDLDASLRSHKRFVGPSWKFYVVGDRSIVQRWHSWEDAFRGNASFIDYPSSAKTRLWLSKSFWSEIPFETVLFTSCKNVILRNGVEDFLKFPVLGNKHPTRGLLIMRRKSVFSILDQCKNLKSIDEDFPWTSKECQMLLRRTDVLPVPLVEQRFNTIPPCSWDAQLAMSFASSPCKLAACRKTLKNSHLFAEVVQRPKKRPGKRHCYEGELLYFMANPEALRDLASGKIKSAWQYLVSKAGTSKKDSVEYKCFA